MIELSNISKNYKKLEVLSEFSYNFEQGKVYALIGESGSGKSTLLKIIGNLEKQSSGDITYDKKVLKSNKDKLMFKRNIVSFVFQDFMLLEEETVYKNLAIALKYIKVDDKHSVILDILKDLNLESKIEECVYQLSGDQKQRIAIARSILKENKILLFDEPTGNLDAKNAKVIIEIIKSLKSEGKTIIIATHDNNLVGIADEVINLKIR